MDSSNWPRERKEQAARGYANRQAALRADPAYRAKRRKAAVAAHLAIVVAKSDWTRAKVAQAANISAAQLSKQLSGSVNLTLDSISKFCDAVGWDFDVVFRPSGQPEAIQPWQQAPINRATVLQLVRAQGGAGVAVGDVAGALQQLSAASESTFAANGTYDEALVA